MSAIHHARRRIAGILGIACLTLWLAPVKAATGASVYYVVANADSVMLQCDGQAKRNTAGDHSFTTGQAYSYGCGSSAPASDFTLANHDASMIKCNGGNPKGNNSWLPLNLGQQVIVYCVSDLTPSPTPTPKRLRRQAATHADPVGLLCRRQRQFRDDTVRWTGESEHRRRPFLHHRPGLQLRLRVERTSVQLHYGRPRPQHDQMQWRQPERQ